MAEAYRAAEVSRFAAWVHETDEAMRADLEQRGYTLDETTRAMGLEADGVLLRRPNVELAPPDWSESLQIMGLRPDFLAGADHAAYHLLIGCHDGKSVSTAMAFDHAGDCGIYNVTTLAQARRRGLGTALTALHVHAAFARGCATASLQSTEMAEGVYRAVGFRDLGRILEYVPPVRNAPSRRMWQTRSLPAPRGGA